MLIHANKRWPDSVTANLWPYAVRAANDAINYTPSLQDKGRRSPTEIFTKSKVVSNPKHWKPFGCPVYVLDNDLQGQRPFHKWKQRSKAGVYIGKSPQHGRNVALVLDRDTGLVSPQFHVAFDPTFDTIKQITNKSNWQNKAGFVAQREATIPTAKTKPAPIARCVNPPTTKAPTRAPEGGTKAASRKRKLREEATSTGQAGTPDYEIYVNQLQQLLEATAYQRLRVILVGSLLRLRTLKLERPGPVERRSLHRDSSKQW